MVTAAWRGRDVCLGPRQGNGGTEAINHWPVVERKESSWDVSLPGRRAGAFASPMLASVNKRPTSESPVLLKATLASVWSFHGHSDANSRAVPQGGTNRRKPSLYLLEDRSTGGGTTGCKQAMAAAHRVRRPFFGRGPRILL